MERIKLTGTNLSALGSDFADGGKADSIYWDTEIAGFGLRFRRGGRRTWILQYKVHGADRRYTLGPYPGITAKTARALAQDKLADVWKGNDPQKAKRDDKAKVQAQITLKGVIDNFLQYKQPKLRPVSFRGIKRYLDQDWRQLHGWPITEIKLANIATILDRLERGAPVAAARSRSALSSVFRWAMGRGYTDHNPVANSINPDNGKPRERVLSDPELSAVWNSCDGDKDYHRIVRLLILTACRKSEVGGIRWPELNFDNHTWTIPASRCKNKREHVLPLPRAFWEVVESVERQPGRDFLFGYSDHGFSDWSRAKEVLDQRCGIADWTHHDLRRTAATRMADIGIQPHVIEAVLNHTSGHKAGVAGIYNRSTYANEKKIALVRWAEYVASIVGEGERKILPFPAEGAS